MAAGRARGAVLLVRAATYHPATGPPPRSTPTGPLCPIAAAEQPDLRPRLGWSWSFTAVPRGPESATVPRSGAAAPTTRSSASRRTGRSSGTGACGLETRWQRWVPPQSCGSAWRRPRRGSSEPESGSAETADSSANRRSRSSTAREWVCDRPQGVRPHQAVGVRPPLPDTRHRLGGFECQPSRWRTPHRFVAVHRPIPADPVGGDNARSSPTRSARTTSW
jgi:hypothetical protein